MSEHQASCSVEYGLEASSEIGRKSDKHEVAVVEPGVDERHHETAEAVYWQKSINSSYTSQERKELCLTLQHNITTAFEATHSGVY